MGSLCDRSETAREVYAVAREQSDLAVRLNAERAITIELQFVRPRRSFGQLGNRYCEHGLDESDLTFRDIHSLNVAILNAQALPTAIPKAPGSDFRCSDQPDEPSTQDCRLVLPARGRLGGCTVIAARHDVGANLLG